MIFTGHSKILGVGSYIPKQVVSSVDLLTEIKTESRFGIPATWMDDKLGIVSRRYCEDSDKASDIASIASLRAIEEAQIEPRHLDAIIYCGITGDFVEPGTAHVIQRKLGAENVICKDVANACHGFSDGLLLADMMIAGGCKHILVITAELTRVGRFSIPSLMRTTSKDEFIKKLGFVSVGDAAAGVILGNKTHDGRGIHVFNTKSDGSFSSLCSYDLETDNFLGGMMMENIGRITVRQGIKQASETLKWLGWRRDEIRHLVIHQVGREPFEFCKRMLRFKNANMPMTYDYLGNITTVSLPLGLELVKKYGEVNDKLCIASSGSGIVTSWICMTL